MTRLSTTMKWDLRLQFRQGFYYAAAFVALLLIILLRQLDESSYPLLLPLIVFSNININAFYFIAAMVLLEKGDNVLQGLVVTPLRQWEYLWSKLLTLTLLAIFEQTAVVLFSAGLEINIPLFLSGVILMSILNALMGFIAVVRYDSLNTFIFPSVFITLAMGLPLLDFLGIWTSPIMYLHPLQAPLLLLKGMFTPPAAWQIAYAIGYSLLSIAFFYLWAKRAFYRFLILKQG